ncbi:MMPL family transporter [Corynebacterium atypicum]|uniref:MMPL family transporter n=1 Tax=Corynebacterium atypicum TaxID=191610 RepID=UPI0009FE13EA|nr:MMPL family transporter [Corynebacterium atypicum]
MFHAWGRFAYRHRRLVPVVVIALIALLYLTFGIRLDQRLSQEGWEDPRADSTIGAAIEQDTFGRDNKGDVILLYSAPPGVLADPGNAAQISRGLGDLKAKHAAQIAGITSYFDTRNPQLINADGTKAFAAVSLAGDGEQTLKDFRTIEEDLHDQSGHLPPGVQVKVAGATAVADALDEGMANDIARAEVVALPLVGILLLFVFGSVVAAAMPLIVGILSILGSLGVLSLLAGVAQVNVFAQSVVTLLGLGLAIDYGLFMVSRFREELDKGVPVPQAVATTTATAGQTVVFSAGMVAVALSGLMVFPQAFLKSVAYGAISAVGLAALLSVTVLPSIFGMIGKNIDRFSVRRVSRRGRRLEDTFWWRLPAWAMRHAKAVTVVVAGGLVALTIPLVGITFGGINETYLPPTNETRQAQAEFDQEFPQFRTEPVKLIVTGANNQQLVDVYRQANAVPNLTGRFSASPIQDGTTVLSAGVTDRSHNEQVVDNLRAISAPAGVKVYVAGTPAMEIESIEALFERLPWMALYILAATFILMALVFGSVILPAKAVIMTMLGLGSTLGILTLMFVDGLGSSLFNFTPGPLMSPVLVLIIAIVYGLSTDYEVFLVSRMVEARHRGETTDRSIKFGTAHTGSIITAAALIMIVVAGAFGFSDIVMMKYIAFGMIASLLLDATVIRMLLVPAVMHLLCEDNWWAPAWVRRAYLKMGHGEAHPQPAQAATPPHAEAWAPAPEAPAPQPAPASRAGGDTAASWVGGDASAGAGNSASTRVRRDPDPWTEDTAQPVDPFEAVRGGRTASQNRHLIPFVKLKERLDAEARQLPAAPPRAGYRELTHRPDQVRGQQGSTRPRPDDDHGGR